MKDSDVFEYSSRAGRLRPTNFKEPSSVHRILRLSSRILRAGLNQPSLSMEWHLARWLADCDSVLDLGCGDDDSPLARIPLPEQHRIGVDCHWPSLAAIRHTRVHAHYIAADLRTLDRLFHRAPVADAVVGLDVLEHLTEDDGVRFLRALDGLARKRIVLFTPNGFLEQGEAGGNPYQRHLSGWTAEALHGFGYTVIGLNGWRALRTRVGGYRLYAPVARRIGAIGAPILRRHPHYAVSLLAVKQRPASGLEYSR